MDKRALVGSVSILVAVALTGGCGGGGGGGGGDSFDAAAAYTGSKDSVAPTNGTEATNVAANAYFALKSMSFQPPVSGGMGPGFTGPAGTPVQATDIAEFVRDLTGRLGAAAPSGTCLNGGTYEVTQTGDGKSAGSTFTATFHDCTDPTARLNGSISDQVAAGSLSPHGNYTRAVTVKWFKMESLLGGAPTGDYVAMHGAVTRTSTNDGAGNTSYHTTGNFYYANVNSSIPLNIQTLMRDLDITEAWNPAGDYTVTEEVTLSNTLLGGTVIIHTVTPIVTHTAGGYPQVGQLVATGAAGRKVRVTADGDHAGDPDHVLIEWDLEPDGIYEGQLSSHFGDAIG